MDDVKLNKAAIIERCIARIQEEYGDDEKNLYENYTRQDSIILNIQRACEAAIDLAMHEVRLRHLGIPHESRDAFSLLYQPGGLITKGGADRMMAMVGFRNIAVHDYQELSLNYQYQELSLEVIKRVVEERLDDFLDFARAMLKGEEGKKDQ
jgi:uncharacterized protein YutE (UPF0331/DUF86 family)